MVYVILLIIVLAAAGAWWIDELRRRIGDLHAALDEKIERGDKVSDTHFDSLNERLVALEIAAPQKPQEKPEEDMEPAGRWNRQRRRAERGESG